MYLKNSLIFICLFCVSRTISDDVVDCSSEDIVTSIFNEAIDLNLKGIIRIYENVKINEISSTNNNEFDKNYIDARLEFVVEKASTNLVIYATEHFANYAKEQSAGRLTLKITIACDMGRGRTLIFFQPIKEGNYFSPKFSKDVYEIIMPTPIFSGFDLTLFTDISAKDDDLTNNQIVFKSYDAEFYHIKVSTKNNTSEERKIYMANLTLTRIYLSLSNEITFQITATDNGIPPLSSNATVIVRADSQNSLPEKPQFQQSFYNATLGVDLTLEPLQILLIAETYSSDVTFSKIGGDQNLFSLTHVANIVTIVLTNPLHMSDIISRTHLQFELRAEHKNLIDYGRTAIFVELPNIKENFRFIKPLYEGFIDISGTNLTIDDVIFDITSYSPAVTFELIGDEQQLFRLEQIGNRLKLILTDSNSMRNLTTTTYLTLEIHAMLAELNDTTAIFIRLPESIKRPEFEKTLYIGTITENVLNMERIILLAETLDLNKTDFLLSGNYSDAFEIIFHINTLELRLKNTTVQMELMRETIIYLVLTASNKNLKTFANIVLETFRQENPPASKVFNKSWYIGNIVLNATGFQVLHFESIDLKYNTTANQFSFVLEGDESSNFAVAVDIENNRLYLRMLHSLRNETLEQKMTINLLINAVHTFDPYANDTSVIIIGLPKRECTDVSELTFLPKFDSMDYIISVRPNQMGSLWQATAYIEGSNASIRYSLSVENEHLQRRVAINAETGEIVLLSYVSPGSYDFRIIAANSETFGNTSIKAHLNVESILLCSGVEQISNVANALIIKYINEEEQHGNVLNMTVENCTFEIAQILPNDKPYVYINESTKMLSTIAIDREDIVFAHMVEPQIRVNLRLVCDGDNVHHTKIRNRRDVNVVPAHNYSHVYTNDIPYSKDITILILIIVDINDNAPEFLYPDISTYLGYPDRQICFELFPQYLTQVKAFDKDLALNAEIRYSMRINDHFSIDPASGVIYPTVNALVNEEYTELVVLATDREGGGLSTSVTLFVRRLSAEYFSLLTFSDRKSPEDVLMELNNRTGYSITLVKYAIMPANEPESKISFYNSNKFRRTTDDNEFMQKAWVYVFERNTPINCADFEDKISAMQGAINVESYAAVGLTSNQSAMTKPAIYMENANTGYIAAIISLTIISLTCIGVLIWRIYLENWFCNGSSSEAHCKTSTTTKYDNDISFLYPTINDNCCKDTQLSAQNMAGCDYDEIESSSTGVEFSYVVGPKQSELCANEDEQPKVKFNECIEQIHTYSEDTDYNVERFK